MKKSTKLWTQKNGEKIRICDMTDSHLVNAIKFLNKKANNNRFEIPYPSFQGEMAQYYAESQHDNMMEANVEDLTEEMYPLYSDLMDEAERRKLIVE